MTGMIAGCSTVKIAYNNTDYLLLRYTDGYLDLTSDQKAQLRESLRERLEEHRRDELVQLVGFLKTFNRYASDGLSTQEVDALVAAITPLYRTTVTKTVPVFSPVLVSLSDAQIGHLSEKMQSANREYREEYLDISRAERVRSRTERTINRIEKWTGALTPDQRYTVTEMTKVWPDAALDWYNYRRARQQELLALLRSRVAGGEVEAYLIAWWVNQTGRNEALVHKVDILYNDLKALIVSVDGSLSEAQRKHFTKRLDRLIDTLEDLIPADTQKNYAQLIDPVS
jgi:hypothetical protein